MDDKQVLEYAKKVLAAREKRHGRDSDSYREQAEKVRILEAGGGDQPIGKTSPKTLLDTIKRVVKPTKITGSY